MGRYKQVYSICIQCVSVNFLCCSNDRFTRLIYEKLILFDARLKFTISKILYSDGQRNGQ